MIRTLAARLSTLASRVVPDPFAISLCLALVALVACLIRQPANVALTSRLAVVANEWIVSPTGMWSLLAFTTQMMLVLVLGYSLATTPAAMRLVHRLALLP